MKKVISKCLCLFSLIFFALTLFTSSGTSINNIIYTHLSFDDVELCLKNLKNENYTSILQEPFFNYLYRLNVKYGVKVSLFVYSETLADIEEKYINDFRLFSSWLKFGLHTKKEGGIENLSYNEAEVIWREFIYNVCRITGSMNFVDLVPRLHGFAANKDVIKAFKNGGAVGFLTADDERRSYYLTDDNSKHVYEEEKFFDYENNILFIKTDMRFDWFNKFFYIDYKYKKPKYDTPYNELFYRRNKASFKKEMEYLVVFGYEWEFYDGEEVNFHSWKVESYLDFCIDYNVKFNFPQNFYI